MHNRAHFGPNNFHRHLPHECDYEPSFSIDPATEARIAAYWRRETEHAIRMRIHQEKERLIIRCLTIAGWFAFVCATFAAAFYLLTT